MARRQAVRGGDGDYPSIARRQAARTSVETQAGEKLVRGGGGGGGARGWPGRCPHSRRPQSQEMDGMRRCIQKGQGYVRYFTLACINVASERVRAWGAADGRRVCIVV